MADLSDAAILREVENAMRVLGEGKGSINAVGERLIRRLIGLEHEQIPGTADAWPPMLTPVAQNTGD